MMKEFFSYVQKREWNEGILEIMNGILIDEVYTGDSNAADERTVNNSIGGCYTNGVGLHMIDIFMEELVTVSSSTTETTTPTSTSLELSSSSSSSSSKLLKTDTFLKCIEPYMELACCQIQKLVRMSVCINVLWILFYYVIWRITVLLLIPILLLLPIMMIAMMI